MHREHKNNERTWRTLEVDDHRDTTSFSVYTFKGTDTVAVITSITSLGRTPSITRVQCRTHPDSANIIELLVYTTDSPRPARLRSGDGITLFDRRVLDQLHR